MDTPFSAPGSGLFLGLLSFKVVVEEVGVTCPEVLGDWELGTRVEPEEDEGEAVPDVESFLFLDLLFDSLARESCSC